MERGQRVELNRFVTRWRISTLMHGEHGAMLVCSQLVENVQGQDAKLLRATQVVDEGRHNEVLHSANSSAATSMPGWSATCARSVC